MLSFSSGLAAALGLVSSQTEWVTTLINTLGATRTLECKRATTNTDVWADGTTFLQAALIGPMSGSGAFVTGFGSVGAAVVQEAADLATGYSVLRISGGGEWVQGTLGLTGSGADFTLRASPDANTGFGFGSATTIKAPANLPVNPPGVQLTTFSLTNDGASVQTSSPATFGHSFEPGDWDPVEYDLYARRASDDQAIPLQADAVSYHTDGSVKYAVLTVDGGTINPGQTQQYELHTGAKGSPFAGSVSPRAVGLVAEATIYGVQQVRVVCGVHNGPKFTLGEVVTLRLTMGGINYDYSVTIDAAMAENSSTGGSLYIFAGAMAAQVNTGTTFIAQRVGEGGGYEKFWVEPAATDAGAFTVQIIYTGAVAITYSVLTTYAPPAVWTAALQPTLDTQITASNAGTIPQVQRRLHGPVVSEFRQIVKFKDASNNEHPYLTAFFDTRLYPDGRTWVDVIMENTGLAAANPSHFNYKLDIKIDGTTVHTQPRFWHFSRARWHRAVWKGTNPQIRVTKNLDYFLRSRAVLNYRQDVAPNSSLLNGWVNDVNTARSAKAFYGPMADVLLTAYMPTTGGRSEIAPLPEWMVGFILSQDERAKVAMLAAADASSAVGVHYRDESTGWPAGLDTRPSMSLGIGATVQFTQQPNLWTPDTAHQGSFGYVPYLTTGDAFYLDEMMFWASWNLAVGNPGYRFTSGVGNLIDNQVRGLAWTLRSVAEVTWMLPEWHPRKAYYRNQLDANLGWMNTNKGSTEWAPEPLRALLRPGDYDAPTWQGDFVGCIMSLLRENNETHTVAIHNHICSFIVDRVLKDDEGYCAALAPSYYTYVRADGASGPWLQTWAEYAQKNFPGEYGLACNTLTVIGYPGWAGGEAAYLRAALAAAANAGYVNGTTAFNKFAAMTPGITTDYQITRRWAITTR
jgi:hypothetical protein